MPQDPSLISPAVSVSASALANTQNPPATAQQPPATNNGNGNQPAAKKTDMKSRIATFAKETIDDPNAIPTTVSRQAVHPGDTDPTITPTPVGEQKPPVAAAPSTATDPQNFKQLKDALSAKDAKLAELQAELDKVKPDVELVTTLKAELAAKQKDFDEVKDFRDRTGLLASDVLYNNVTLPRQNIAAAMKHEFKQDGLKEELWDEAIATITNRTELEAFAKEHITSDLLRGQFYELFFKDSTLRQHEAQALQAPAKYLKDFKDQETAKQNEIRAMNAKNFDTTLQLAQQDATDMVAKLGANKLVELLEIPDNPEHNEKVVKPLLEAAHNGAVAMLKERLVAGLPVTREDAARTIYLWRNGIAAQAINADRMRWFNTAQELEEEVVKLREKLEVRTARNSPTPGGREASPAPSGNGTIPGKDFKERIANMAKMSKEGEL